MAASSASAAEEEKGSCMTNEEHHHHQVVNVVVDKDVSTQSFQDWFMKTSNEEEREEEEGEEGIIKMEAKAIVKVPKLLKNMKSNKNCFNPFMVSIGPYHHGTKELIPAEKIKLSLTQQFVSESKSDLWSLYNKVEKVAASDARKCYPESVFREKGIDERSFVKMMMIDGCFVLQFMKNNMNSNHADELKSHQIAWIQRDLFLLENQLPFDVLMLLVRIKYGEEKEAEGLKMMMNYIKCARALPEVQDNSLISKIKTVCGGAKTPEESITPTPTDRNSLHLLDLMWKQLIDDDDETQQAAVSGESNDWHSFRSVSELKNSGIHFRRSMTDRYTDVRYDRWLLFRAKLTLPPMTVDDSTKTRLLNLVAYEMSPNGPKKPAVTSFIWLIDSLIDSAEDVKELRKQRILLNFLGSDQQVADIFNEVTNELVPEPRAYSKIKSRIEKHYKSKMKLWVVEWWNTHFDSPWTILAFLGATFALFLSAVQTYISVYPSSSK